MHEKGHSFASWIINGEKTIFSSHSVEAYIVYIMYDCEEEQEMNGEKMRRKLKFHSGTVFDTLWINFVEQKPTRDKYFKIVSLLNRIRVLTVPYTLLYNVCTAILVFVAHIFFLFGFFPSFYNIPSSKRSHVRNFLFSFTHYIVVHTRSQKMLCTHTHIHSYNTYTQPYNVNNKLHCLV